MVWVASNGVIAAAGFVLASLETGNRASRADLIVVQRAGSCAGLAGKSGPVETVPAVSCGMAEGWMDIDWAAIPGPPEYHPDHVVRAFQALLHPTAEDWSDAGTMMRFAVGNDCGGSIYPAAVEATRAMLDLIAAYPGEPRTVALCVLLDWWAGFDPEPGYEQYDTAEAGRVDLISAMRDTVLNRREVLQQAATDPRDPRGARLAAQLWTCAQAGWGYAVEDDGSLHHRFDD